jgi:hypothetical protein
MKYCLLLSLALTGISLQAQIQFENRYSGHPGSEVKAMTQCLDTGYIMVGGASQSIAIVRTDQYGDSLWTYSASSPSQFGFNVEQCLDSNFIVCGYVIESNSSNAMLLKLNDLGDTLWMKSHGQSGSNWIQSIVQLADSGFIGVGSRFYRFNKHGDEVWSQNTVGGNQAISMILTTDSHIVYTTTSTAQASGGSLIKMDLDGTQVMSKNYSFAHFYNNSDNNVAETSDGGFILAAQPTDVSATLILKTDSDGDTVWTRRYPDANLGSGMGVIESDSGGYLACDFSLDGTGVHAHLYRLDASGDDMWMRTYDQASAQSLVQTFDGGYAFSGYRENGGGTRKFYLAKIGGSIELSVPQIEDQKASIYPRVSDGIFQIICTDCIGTSYQVFDMQGMLVHQSRLTSTMDLTHLRTGYYILVSDTGTTQKLGIFK